MAQFRLLGDQPNAFGRDALGFFEVVQRLSNLILSSRESSPFTVGVDGGWGTGKSSLMLRLKTEFDGRDDVVTVWFNAWTAQGDDVLEGLIKSVLNEIDSNILRRALRRKKLLNGSRVALSLLADILRIRTLTDEIWRSMEVSVETRNHIQGLMEDAMSEWTTKNAGPGSRLLVVFIDDLDRCSPASVLKVFEAMKLYLGVKGFVFVVGYDEQVISDAVLRKLGYNDEVKARDYLEKIVQFTHSITPPTDDQARILVDEYLAEADVASLVQDSERSFLIERGGRNPRRIKRFINNFVLAYQLDPEWQDIGAQNLLKALILQMYYPEVVTSIWRRRGRDIFQECLDFVEARRLLRTPHMSEQEIKAVERVFVSYNLDVNVQDSPYAETLRILQEEIPAVILKVANDSEFVRLAENISPGEDRKQLLQKLELRRSDSALVAADLSTDGRPSVRAGELPARGMVYLSYRRDDARHVVGRLADALGSALGRDSVFLDVDSIRPGQSFPEAMREGLERATAVLALIGPNWLTAQDQYGRRRVDDPEDSIRSELEVALDLGKPVIPVLIDEAQMPRAMDVPQSLLRLTRRNAVSLTASSFDADTERLVGLLHQFAEPTSSSRHVTG